HPGRGARPYVASSGGVVADASQPPASGSRCLRHRLDQKVPFMAAKSIKEVFVIYLEFAKRPCLPPGSTTCAISRVGLAFWPELNDLLRGMPVM
ncbi:MAG: hypothetical protein WCJ40_13185, partial [Planctomycetota bacterium]